MVSLDEVGVEYQEAIQLVVNPLEPSVEEEMAIDRPPGMGVAIGHWLLQQVMRVEVAWVQVVV